VFPPVFASTGRTNASVPTREGRAIKLHESCSLDAASRCSDWKTKAASCWSPSAGEPRAMVYAADVRRALGFYRDLLGFKLVDEISPRRYTRVCAAARA
jgi:hypothetical protein